MGKDSSIEWAHHTFNPWIGCQKVSPACDNCYAEAWDKRFKGDRWGSHANRTRTKTWREPSKWNREAEAAGVRYRVFCASLADIFDNHRSIQPEWRADLWQLIRDCTNLDFLLLTKRPGNIVKYLPDDWGNGYHNVWLGATIENQKATDRLVALTCTPAVVRFVSAEPLLGPVNLGDHIRYIHWVIAGGENAINYRPVNPDWFRYLRDQCSAAGVPFLFKQWEGRSQKLIKQKGRELDGVEHNGYPERTFFSNPPPV